MSRAFDFYGLSSYIVSWTIGPQKRIIKMAISDDVVLDLDEIDEPCEPPCTPGRNHSSDACEPVDHVGAVSLAPGLTSSGKHISMVDFVPTVLGITREEQFHNYLKDINDTTDVSNFASLETQINFWRAFVNSSRLQITSFESIKDGNKMILRYLIDTKTFTEKCPFSSMTVDLYSTNLTNMAYINDFVVDNYADDENEKKVEFDGATIHPLGVDDCTSIDLAFAKITTSDGKIVYVGHHVSRALDRAVANDYLWFDNQEVALNVSDIIIGIWKACRDKERTVCIVEGENEVVRDQEGFFMRDTYLSIVNDIKTFLDSKSLFREAGIAYRRGYLMYGPPGNGKSQLARYLFNEFKEFNLYAYYHTERRRGGSVDERLERTFAMARDNAPSFLLLEDLDRIVSHGSASKEVITIDRLFNMMDGVCSPEGIVLLATCNHPENLDMALLGRPGRFDRVIEVGHPDRAERESLIAYLCSCGEKYKLNAKEHKAVAQLADATENLSMAYVKELYSRAFLKSLNAGRRTLPISPLILLDLVREIVDESRNVDVIARRTGFRTGYEASARGEDRTS